MKKLRIGLYCLSSCEGCIVQILNLEEELLEMMKYVDIVECRVLGIRGGEPVDVAFVEGFVASRGEERKLVRIREKTKILVAIGDCACSGGKFLIKDFDESEIRADPLNRFVRVDYYLWGCPIDQKEFFSLVRSILHDRKIQEISRTVCSECILYEEECLLDRGVICFGPITQGGCDALCPRNGRNCIGCRGLSEDANIEAFIEILQEKGIPLPQYLFRMRELRRDEGKTH